MPASPSANPNDNFPTASLRHFHDAEILLDAHSYENALCHYAFSVECGQKALLYWSNHMRPRRQHQIDADWQDVAPLLYAWASLDGGLASAIPTGQMPQKLYEKHPERRYEKCFPITISELHACAAFSKEMEETIISMMIDGLITDQGGYTP